MMDQDARKRVKDSTLYRIARDIGFNARVEPYWHSFERLRHRLGFFERWREKRRLKRIAVAIRTQLGDGDWLDLRGECVCNLRVAKIGLVAEFQEYLRTHAPAERLTAWKHLMAQRDRNAYMLPVEFREPFSVNPSEVSVTSAARMAEELKAVNDLFHIDETFALAKARKVDYLDATERDISSFESRFGSLEGFWAKFAYVLLRKLSETSVEKGMPAIFA